MNKYMNSIGIKARKAYGYKINTKKKNKVLNCYAELLEAEKKFLISQNLQDIKFAKKIKLKENLIDRLRLNQKKNR